MTTGAVNKFMLISSFSTSMKQVYLAQVRMSIGNLPEISPGNFVQYAQIVTNFPIAIPHAASGLPGPSGERSEDYVRVLPDFGARREPSIRVMCSASCKANSVSGLSRLTSKISAIRSMR